MRFNHCWLCLAVIAVLLSVTRSVSAQRFGSRTNSIVSLGSYEAVQKDIGVSGETAEKLSKLGDDFRNATQRDLEKQGIDYTAISDLPAAERAMEMRKAAEKSIEANRRQTAAFMPKLEELLSSEQIERLKQIQLQAAGIDAWTEPLWAKELDLSEVQKAQLAELRNEYRRRADQLDGDFTQRIARSRELNTERDTKAIDLLNDVQKAKLSELKGKPFDVSQLGFRRRGNN